MAGRFLGAVGSSWGCTASTISAGKITKYIIERKTKKEHSRIYTEGTYRRQIHNSLQYFSICFFTFLSREGVSESPTLLTFLSNLAAAALFFPLLILTYQHHHVVMHQAGRLKSNRSHKAHFPGMRLITISSCYYGRIFEVWLPLSELSSVSGSSALMK